MCVSPKLCCHSLPCAKLLAGDPPVPCFLTKLCVCVCVYVSLCVSLSPFPNLMETRRWNALWPKMTKTHAKRNLAPRICKKKRNLENEVRYWVHFDWKWPITIDKIRFNPPQNPCPSWLEMETNVVTFDHFWTLYIRTCYSSLGINSIWCHVTHHQNLESNRAPQPTLFRRRSDPHDLIRMIVMHTKKNNVCDSDFLVHFPLNSSILVNPIS